MIKTKTIVKPPSTDVIITKRKELGLTQTEAAAVIYKALRTWQHWEVGSRSMDYALWELFLIKTGPGFLDAN